MTWVRYDDNVANHPKVAPLDDATYRLWREAIEWCAHNLTDGVVLTRQLGLTSTRASAARARKLVDSGLWHKAGNTCDSSVCPPSGPNGWVIHDYWDYQPTREKVQEDQEAKRERQRRYMDKVRAGRRGAPDDASHNASHDPPDGASDDANPAPPRPAPKGSGAGDPPRAPGRRRSAADADGAGRAEDQTLLAHPPPHNGTHTPASRPPDLAGLRKQLAGVARRARAGDRRPGDALAELRTLTEPTGGPDDPPDDPGSDPAAATGGGETGAEP